MEVVRDLDRPAGPKFYTVAGRLLFVQGCDPQLQRLLDQLFAGWQLTQVPSTDKQPHVSVRCFYQHPFPQIPANLDQFEIAEGGLCHLDGRSFYLELRDALIHLSVQAELIVDVWFRDRPGINDPILARALSFAVCAGLRRHGIFDVHAAGVVAPGQSAGVLIIGPSGSGKSTLTMQLVASGWDYLSDDELLLSSNGARVEVRGFRRFFALSEQALLASGIEEFTSLVGPELTTGFKVCFEPHTMFQSNQIEFVEPGILLFTRIADRVETQLSQLSPADTMARLLRACPWATYDKPIAAQNLDILSRLARQSVGFDLAAGRDLLSRGQAASLLAPYI